MRNTYFSLSTQGQEVDIYIFGDIVSWEWLESDVSSYSLAKTIAALTNVATINVHINSYGGEVAEGLAIHNALKNHPAKIVTIVDGFACSAASVVFMAGEDRIMNLASLLMIHNAWSYAAGNAEQLRKVASDLEVISATAAATYRERISITDAELDALLENESWITPDDALKWGFATEIKQADKTEKAAASAMSALMRVLTEPQATPMPNADAFEQMRQDIAAIRAAISLPKASEPEPQPEPQPEPEAEPQEDPAKEQEKKPIDFLNALSGRKEQHT